MHCAHHRHMSILDDLDQKTNEKLDKALERLGIEGHSIGPPGRANGKVYVAVDDKLLTLNKIYELARMPTEPE